MNKSKTNTSRQPTRIGRAALGIVGALCLLPTTWAQVQDHISSETGTLNATQIQAMATVVERLVTALESPHSKEAKEATRDLLTPLSKPATSRTFRFAYGEMLAPKLSRIIENKEATIQARISSLNILGTIASDAVLSVLDQALTSDESAIRYAAALGYHRAFEGISKTTHAFGDERQASRDMTRRLHQALVIEQNPLVLNALISACAANPDGAYALKNLCTGLMDHMKSSVGEKIPPGMISVYENGIQLALKQYITLLTEGKNERDQEKLLVQLGYMVMKLSLIEAEKNQVNEKNTIDYQDLIKSGENLLDVVCTLEDDPAVTQRQRNSVSTAFTAEDYAAAARALQNFWLKADGPIYGKRNAFGFQTGSFEKLFD